MPRASPGATALTLTARGQLVTGFRDGNLELRSLTDEQPRSAVSFDEVPSSPVTRLLPGPMHTLFAGYANGVVGIWSLDTGQQLHRAQLHGPVTHLAFTEGVLYVATDLGHFHAWDLGVFADDRCELLRAIWDRIPVVWGSGHASRREPPQAHDCRESSLR